VAERPDPHLLEKAGGQVLLVEEDGSGGIAARRKLTPDEGWLVATDGRKRAGGALRRVLIYEVLRRDMLLEWANFSRKLKGIIQGIYREGALDEERSAAERALREAVRHNYLLTSEAITFNFHRLVQESAGLNFERLLDKLDADIAIAILGQANTSELPDRGGSRAALQVLDMIRSDIHYSDMIRAERLMQQVVDMDYRRNVSRQGEVPWRFAWDWSEVEEDAREREARVIGEVLDAGVPLLADEVYSRLGFTRPEGVPDIIERQRGF
jgi:phage gp29-like protein